MVRSARIKNLQMTHIRVLDNEDDAEMKVSILLSKDEDRVLEVHVGWLTSFSPQ
jgi:hypothetical protein